MKGPAWDLLHSSDLFVFENDAGHFAVDFTKHDDQVDDNILAVQLNRTRHYVSRLIFIYFTYFKEFYRARIQG